MNTTEFTRKKAIKYLKLDVISEKELARLLTDLAFRLDGEATVIHVQQLELKRLDE